ncbi:MAG: hypothetical protein EZS28_021703 [Streblomastix strix]|uniref:Uncharacterized protein n=1 Tax=Streblomastix strix TaxID=222440 RepID=A0A5J4VJN1_9EUKA|nr:MAG: hypothetical protein EZS28_021703 [Streblomastix strix]
MLAIKRCYKQMDCIILNYILAQVISKACQTRYVIDDSVAPRYPEGRKTFRKPTEQTYPPMNDCWHLMPTSLLDTIVNSSLTYLSMLRDSISRRLKGDVRKNVYDTQVQ